MEDSPDETERRAGEARVEVPFDELAEKVKVLERGAAPSGCGGRDEPVA